MACTIQNVNPLDSKEIRPVNPKGNQPRISTGRTDADAEAPVLWPLNVKNGLTGKDSDAGKDWGQKGKGTTEDEMAGWHHWLDGRESEWTPGVGDGQGGLACCDSWGLKESDTTEGLNWTLFIWTSVFLSLFLHLCNICLPFHDYFLNLLCLRSPFPRLQSWILSSFWFLSS